MTLTAVSVFWRCAPASDLWLPVDPSLGDKEFKSNAFGTVLSVLLVTGILTVSSMTGLENLNSTIQGGTLR